MAEMIGKREKEAMIRVKNAVLCILLSWSFMFGNVMDGTVSLQAETTVLVTRTGSRYHAVKCGNGTYYKDTESAARARGLTPCQKCFGSGYRSTGTSGSTSAGSAAASSGAQNKKPAAQSGVVKKPIAISEDSMLMLKGDHRKLSVKNTSGTVTWSSSNKSTVSVSNGTVTAKKKGRAVITVSADGQKKSCKVTVEDPQISKTRLNMKIEEQMQLKIKGCNHEAVWKSSSEDTVYAGERGIVTAVTPGTAVITARVHGRKYTCKVTSELPEIHKLQVLNPSDSINRNSVLELEFITDNDSVFDYEDIAAVSSDDTTVSVSSAAGNRILLQAHDRAGTAEITASIGGAEISFTVTVSDEPLEDDESSMG